MQEKYKITQHKIYKAIIRPVLFFGVPLELFFCIAAFLFGIGLYFGPIVWFFIPVVILSLGLLTRKDAFFFHILYLKWKTSWHLHLPITCHPRFPLPWYSKQKRQNAKVNKTLGCQAVSGARHTADTQVGICKVVRRRGGGQ